MKLHISDDLSLPADAVTSTLVVYGGKGMGKTNFGSVLVEELAANGLRWAWLDPLGVSWGLRHSKDGRGPGIECLILGGTHGDVPIEPDGGAAVADVVVDEQVNVLIDFSRKPSGEMWGVGEKIRFVTAYTRRLFQRQGDLIGGRRREPLFQVLDEAARYVPQIIPASNPDLSKCVSAWQQLVEEGRNIGLGVGLISQRSARMNKDVSELADAMFAFRTIGPNSLGAVLDWLGEHVEKARIKELSEKVRTLPVGRALIVSPGWLKFEGVATIRQRHTFDSSATPKPGEQSRKVSGEGAKPDLDKIRNRMAETIERAKADDPKELKAKIRDLEQKLTAKPAESGKSQEWIDEYVRGAIATATAAAIQGRDAQWRTVAMKVGYFVRELEEKLSLCSGSIAGAVSSLGSFRIDEPDVPESHPAPPSFRDAPPTAPKPFPPQFKARAEATYERSSNGSTLPRGELAVLKAAASRENGVDKKNLRVLTGFKRSTRDAYIARLREKGFVEDSLGGGTIVATRAGKIALGDRYEPLPTGRELREQWLVKLPEGERRVLELLIRNHPRFVDHDSISDGTEFKRSTRDAYLYRLRARGLILSRLGESKASDDLF